VTTNETTPAPDAAAPDRVSFAEALPVWARIGLLSFGGPAGQIAMMHRELVERRRWIDEARFLHALNYCTLLPGPEAQQLATYIGWLMHGTRGGLAAGLLFVLPGFVAILALSILYATLGDLTFVVGLFFGLKAAVLAIVVEALLRIGKRALKTRAHHVIAWLAFVAIFFFDVPFPAIVLGAGLVGLVGSRLAPRAFPPPTRADEKPSERSVVDAMAARGELAHTVPSAWRALRIAAVCLFLWALPFVPLGLAFGWRSVFVDEGVFFGETAMVTFGGAYAVLAYVAQRAVDDFGWLRPGEMLDGLGLAETTPGPLVMVLQFVAFMGAYRDPSGLSPIAAGVLGSLVTVWVTFVPCFAWIFVGAPFIESLRGNASLHAALSAITASVVGVIGNLSIWLALHVVFRVVDERRAGPLRLVVPDPSSIDLAALALIALALVMTFRFALGVPRTLGVCALAGIAWGLVR